MVGKSHLLIGLTAGVVFDHIFHVSGPPLTTAPTVTTALLASKAIYYFAVGFGALLPDIDNAQSTLGQKLGWFSKQIQHLAGHRTVFHSLLGLAIGSALSLGAGQLIVWLLSMKGIVLTSEFLDGSMLIFFGVLFGCVMHIAADALTLGGVPLLWPYKQRFGFPPNSHWRFRTGDWPETVIVWSFLVLVVAGVWQQVIVV